MAHLLPEAINYILEQTVVGIPANVSSPIQQLKMYARVVFSARLDIPVYYGASAIRSRIPHTYNINHPGRNRSPPT